MAFSRLLYNQQALFSVKSYAILHLIFCVSLAWRRTFHLFLIMHQLFCMKKKPTETISLFISEILKVAVAIARKSIDMQILLPVHYTFWVLDLHKTICVDGVALLGNSCDTLKKIWNWLYRKLQNCEYNFEQYCGI